MPELLRQVAATPAALLGSAAWAAGTCAVLGLPLADWSVPVGVAGSAGAVAWLDSLLHPSVRNSPGLAPRVRCMASLCAAMAAVAAAAWIVREGRSLASLPEAKDVALSALAVGAPCGACAAAAGVAALRVLRHRRRDPSGGCG